MIGGQHILTMAQFCAADIAAILATASSFRAISRRSIKKIPSLRGRTVLNVFYEPSTRTRVSFELAAKRLSADAVNISASTSSVSKGESLRDTAQTLDAMQADVLVLRHPHSGAAAAFAKHVRARVINAGDGAHDHPTQALSDLFTLQQHFGRLRGLKVAIVGDILHSRVARANLIGLRCMGAEVRLAGPRQLLGADRLQAYGAQLCGCVEEALCDADVVMPLRLQLERLNGGLLPSLREYALAYGISAARLQQAAAGAVLMHPGPVNRGVEVAPELVDGPQSVILDQVESGVAVRAALLYMILADEGTPAL